MKANKHINLNEMGVNWSEISRKNALHYAKLGWKVIPLHTPITLENGMVGCSCTTEDCDKIGKHPRIANWRGQATTDAAIIEEWFRMWPDMNIGIVTGSESGLAVLDADGRIGKRSLMSLPPIPSTSVVRSGVGLHYYFEHPGNDTYIKTLAGVEPGIDSRGEGGYVCAPPSLHKRGHRYEWFTQDKLAMTPQWWIERVERPVVISPQEVKFDVTVNNAQISSYGKKALEDELAVLYSTPIGQQKRNSQLNRSAFSLYQLVAGGCLDESLVDSCLWEAAINGMQMNEVEAQKTLNSGKTGGMARPRSLPQQQK